MVDGDVIIDRKNIQLNARKGMKLEEADVVTTIGKSKVQLKFLDNTLVNLGKDSIFNIEEYFISEQKNDIKANFSIPKGAFKIATGLISKVSPKKFHLKSRTATIGIRGTEIVGKISDTADIIACTSGLIAVGTLGLDVEPILVKAGMMTEVMSGVVPSKPKEFTASDLKSLVGDVGEIIIKKKGDKEKEEEPAADTTKEEGMTESEEGAEETVTEVAVETVVAEAAAAPLPLPETDLENISNIATQTALGTIQTATAEQQKTTRTGGFQGFTAAYIGSDPTGSYVFGKNDNPEDFWIGQGTTPGSIEAELKIKTSGGAEYSLMAKGGEEYFDYENDISYIYAVGNGGWIDSPGYSSEGLDNYDYLTWGEWGSYNESYEYGDSGWWNGWWGHWIAGDMTPEYAIPQSGSAYYAGEVRGEVYYLDPEYPGRFDYLTGTSSIDVDFGAKTLSGTLNMDIYGERWKSAALSASWSAGNPVITGKLSTSYGDTGDVKAAFFGPAAQELGGSWNLDTGNEKAVGTFSAKQSKCGGY